MKAFKFNLVIFFVSICLVSIAQNQDPRGVVFAHGQGGNNLSWEVYDSIFSGERRMIGIRRNWQERNGLAAYGGAMANTVQTVLNPAPNTPEEQLPLGIGHSNGGLGLRSMDQAFPEPNRILGGIITAGTPHRGGAIINGIQNGTVQSSLNRGCRALTAGPATHIGGDGFIIQGYIASNLCSSLLSIFNLEGQIADLSAQEAAVNSQFLETLNETPPVSNIISIYGNEESPVHWRLLSSLDSDNESDQRFVTIANIAQGLYAGTSAIYGVSGVVRIISGIVTLNPVAISRGAYNAFQSVQYARGAIWLANSEQHWLDALDCQGSSTFTQTFTTTVYPCTNLMTGSAEWLQCMEENNCLGAGGIEGCSYQVIRTRRVTVNPASDGFFCVDTQIFDPFDTERNYEAEGVNHSDETNTTFMQTRNNNDEMRETFNEIFNRNDEFAIMPL